MNDKPARSGAAVRVYRFPLKRSSTPSNRTARISVTERATQTRILYTALSRFISPLPDPGSQSSYQRQEAIYFSIIYVITLISAKSTGINQCQNSHWVKRTVYLITQFCRIFRRDSVDDCLIHLIINIYNIFRPSSWIWYRKCRNTCVLRCGSLNLLLRWEEPPLCRRV